jgi:diguanylate cyclase (GGDEF)-like protein/PAS domain S-box-containing protein
MTGKTVPRYLALTATLSLVVGGLMLSVFYGQYRTLAGRLVETSAEQFDVAQSASFERRARARMHRIADAIALHIVVADANDINGVMQTSMDGAVDLNGLRFVDNSGNAVAVGDIGIQTDETTARDDALYLSYTVRGTDSAYGKLYGNFALGAVQAETAAFREFLVAQDSARQSASFLRILATALFGVALCGTVIWLVVRNQSQRILALRTQAKKLAHANFGEPLAVLHSDDLGDLAQVFNEMRSELQRTTVSHDFLDKMLSGMNEAIIVTNGDGHVTRINGATTRMLGYEEDDLLGVPIADIVDSTKSGKLQTRSETSIPDEAILTSKDGDLVPVSYTGSVIETAHDKAGTQVFAAQNITERRKAEQRIRYLARIDALTKVPNRMQFQHLLQRAIARAKRSGNSIALFYIDVDHFKEINDTFGHLAGDTTLETVANRLAETLPEDCIIGRLAGDEFAVIVDRIKPSTETTRHLDKLARKLLNGLAEPFDVQGHEVFMTASMGIACCPQDAINVIDLIRNADAALYHAKKVGGNEFSYYRPEMNHAAVERLMTKSKLKRAFERDELLVRYHPRYNIETGEVVGAEALVRWDLPERGIVLPADFIPLAEETNLIVEIGEWVLDRVCEDFRNWQRSVTSPGRVSVNLSLKQLRQSNFISRISGILRSYELSPTSLELEITETTLMENPVRTVKILDELYSLGLHLAIDDFGTGYSSLSALQQFPISTLKIDQSFVRDVAINPDDATIVGTIIQMGKSLNMEVVAEGVESEDQLGFLQNLGCAFVQGLLFGAPMSADDYLDLVLSQAEGTDKYRALFA